MRNYKFATMISLIFILFMLTACSNKSPFETSYQETSKTLLKDTVPTSIIQTSIDNPTPKYTESSTSVTETTVKQYSDDDLAIVIANYWNAVDKAKGIDVKLGVMTGKSEDTDSFTVQIFEVHEDHVATLQWYIVNRITRIAVSEFPIEGEGSLNINELIDQGYGEH